MTQKNLYAVLGLDKGASDDDIKKQYYALAKKYHPDKNQDANAEEKFKEIGKAYEALKDPEARRDYELQRRAEEMDARATAMAKNPTKFTFSGGRFKGNAFGFSSDDLHDIFRSTFRQRNKENRKPENFGRPEWDENWSESSTGGPSSFTFTFSNGFSEQPRPPPSRMGNIDDMFDDFFRDPFFMDSSPFGDNDPTCGGNYHQDEPVRPQTSGRTQTRPEPEDNPRVQRAREEALRKAARDDELKRTREEAQRNAAREEAKRKAEEEKMYDWQNGLFGRANRGEGETGPNTSIGGATSRLPTSVAGSRQDYTFSVYDNDPTSWCPNRPSVPIRPYVPVYVPSSGRFHPFTPAPQPAPSAPGPVTGSSPSFTADKNRKSMYDNNNNMADYDESYQYDKTQVPFSNGPSYSSRPFCRETFSPIPEEFSPKRDTFSPKRDTFSPKRDTFSPKRDTFSPKRDTFSPNRDTFSPNRDTFSPKRETFSPKRETFSPNRETFSPRRDTFSPKRETFSPKRDTFSPKRDTFSPKRDTFSPNREPLSSNNDTHGDPEIPTTNQRPNLHSTGPGSYRPYYFDESPPGTKLICNYCQNKFHPATLTAHENVCRADYYGKQEREADSPSPPPMEDPVYTPRSQTRRPPPRSQSFTARSSGTGSGASKPSFKDDLLRNAYRAAAYETLASQPVREEPIALNMQVCEYCNIAFSDTVAKYHIPFCGRKHGKTTASAATPSSTSASDTRRPEYSNGEPSSTYRSTYRAPPSGPRPAPRTTAAAAAASAAGASGFDRINSPSFTNLGANIGRPRSTATTHDYTAAGPASASASVDYNYDYPDNVYISPSYSSSIHTPSYSGIGRTYGSLGRTDYTADYDPYTYSTPLSNRVGRTSSSTTRIRYVPASGVRTRGRTVVGN